MSEAAIQLSGPCAAAAYDRRWVGIALRLLTRIDRKRPSRVPQPFGCDTIVDDSDGYEWQMLKSWTGHVYDGIKIGLTRC